MGQGDTVEEALSDHDKNLHSFLLRAQERGLRVNASKFKYRLTEVADAGQMLSLLGLREDPKKIEAVTEMATHGDLAGVRRFLGIANFLGKFIKDLVDIASH